MIERPHLRFFLNCIILIMPRRIQKPPIHHKIGPPPVTSLTKLPTDIAATPMIIKMDPINRKAPGETTEEFCFELFPEEGWFLLETCCVYETPVPGTEILVLTPDLELTETPPCFPPTLTPTLFFPTLSFTPGATLMLFLTRRPIYYLPFLLRYHSKLIILLS